MSEKANDDKRFIKATNGANRKIICQTFIGLMENGSEKKSIFIFI